ncbi:hypothetical protein H9Y04_38535 [Streptomyces sp. TRM66268-LWL]|uniref:Uncharacterized protein n=1 Tax=Streptomyces polyasparticus TaxID=2767826 RepID=A0ABR7SVR6_9ACTN|nr:hypothetical protein [Streptomyces polyasparticus]MBC9718438.1 hypothetical protein [Streptomyces polyasparticus]
MKSTRAETADAASVGPPTDATRRLRWSARRPSRMTVRILVFVLAMATVSIAGSLPRT